MALGSSKNQPFLPVLRLRVSDSFCCFNEFKSSFYIIKPSLERSSRPEVFSKKGALRNFTKFTENTRARVSFLMAQVFSREFYEISKNTFFHRTPLVAASVYKKNIIQGYIHIC